MKTNSSKIRELREALEKATGPDRELDKQIWLSIQSEATRQRCIILPDAISEQCVQHGRLQWSKVHTIPAYTSSIDAAMMLRPPGWFVFAIEEYPNGDWMVTLGSRTNDREKVAANGSSLARAYAAASLRARSAT